MDGVVRRLRAVVLICGAVAAAVAVSYGWLRPATRPAAPATVVAQQTQSTTVRQYDVTGRANGGYFVWTGAAGGSGGHANP